MPSARRLTRTLLATLALAAAGLAAAQPYGLTARSTIDPYLGTMPATDPGGNCSNIDQGQVRCLLSLTGAFASISPTSLTPHAGLVPYSLNQPLWSDGSFKTRWIALPYDSGSGTNPTIGFAPTGEWTFPNGTVLVKHFELVVNEQTGERRRMETRLLVRNANGFVYGRSYRWNPALNGTDAEAVNNSGVSDQVTILQADGTTTRQQRWDYPAPQQCLSCHTQAAGGVLGPKTRQMNGTFQYEATGVTDNQIRTWNHLGMFNTNVTDSAIATFYRLANVADDTRTLEDRARSYVDANCSHCHRPAGPAQFTYHGLYDTPVTELQNFVGSASTNPNAVLQRFNVAGSDLITRDNRTSAMGGMPPLSKNVVDTYWIETVSAWVNYAFDLVSAQSYGSNTKMRVVFDRPVDAATATLAANYAIGGITVQSAVLEPGGRVVTLTTSAMAPNASYTVTVNRVREMQAPGNPVWPNSNRNFMNAVPANTVSFALASYTVNEVAGQAVLGVTRTGSAGAVSVAWATSDGSALAGSDYTAASGTLVWAAGDTATKFITVSVSNDGSFEPNEAFQVYLHTPGGGAVIGANLAATVTIQDNDIPVAARGDLSGDNKADLVFQNTNGAIAAWLMNGIAQTASANLVGAGQGWSVTHLADLDGDLKNDIFFKNTDGRVHVFRMNGLAVIGGRELLGAGQGWSVSHAADLSGDGKADLLLKHADGRSHLWLMDGFTIVGSAGLQGAGSPWTVTHTGDFNGDGRGDIVWAHSDGRAYLYLMNGTTVTAGAEFLAPASGWIVSHVADLNGDGKSDLIFRHADGRAHLYLMNGTTFGAGAQVLGAASGWMVTHTGDFNGDGKADLVFRHTDGRAHVRLMNGTATLAGGDILSAGSGWMVTRVMDFNGDGKSDLVFRDTDGRITVRLQNGLAEMASANLVGAGAWSVVPTTP